MKDDIKNVSNHDLQHHIEPERNIPRWKQIHHSWVFWLVLALMMFGITYYIITVNFAFAPERRMVQPASNTITP
jgi:hypothetical protein